jgi:hypothetical protein
VEWTISQMLNTFRRKREIKYEWILKIEIIALISC